MIRLLLILTSLLGLKLNALEYSEYEVKPGDTLSQIAYDLGVELEKIYLANKELGFNPNRIEIGQKIYIPGKFDIVVCPPASWYDSTAIFTESSEGYFLNSDYYFNSIDELNSLCMDEEKAKDLFEVTEEEAIKLMLEDKSYQNSLMYYFSTSQENSSLVETVQEVEKIEKLYCKGLINGVENFLSQGSLFNITFCDFSAEEIKRAPYSKEIKQALLYLISQSSLDEALQIKYKLIPLDLRVRLQLQILSEMIEKNHKDISNFINETYISVLEQIATYPLFTSEEQAENLANFMFYALNYEQEKKAITAFLSFLDISCNRCGEAELKENFTNLGIYTSFGGRGAGYHISVINMALINFYSALDGFLDTEIHARRLWLESSILDDLTLPTWSKNYQLSILWSDIGISFAHNGECDSASEYLNASLNLSDIDIVASNAFREPMEVANCYLKKGNISAAKELMNTALISKDFAIKNNIYYEAMAVIAEGLIQNDDDYVLKAYDMILNTPNLTTAYKKDFEVAIDMLFLVEEIKKTNSIDYIKLKNKLNSIATTENLLKAKIYSNKAVETLQKDLESVSLSIYTLESEIVNASLTSDRFKNFKKESLLVLYDQKKQIIQSIFDQSDKINNLYNGYANEQELMAQIPPNTKILSYFILEGSAWAVIYSSDTKVIQSLATNGGKLKSQTTLLTDSLNENEEYDFDAAHKIYEMIFSELENNFERESSILIYDSDKLRVPLSILVKSIPNSSNYERALLEADWLIKDYAFGYLYPIKKKTNEMTYKESFLGLANSSSYEWAELPPLKSAITEVQNLALSSGAKKENILIGDAANKEIFLEKLQSSYERIVIATHAVPEGWKGYTNESSLVFASNKKDFFFTSSEIAQQEFKSEMVVLSSCSGITDDFRDLYKAFLVAGAESVVHANWQLESRFASEFTDEFFKELWRNDGLQKHEAMRNVALSFLDDYSNPLYADPIFWGNFSIGYSNL